MCRASEFRKFASAADGTNCERHLSGPNGDLASFPGSDALSLQEKLFSSVKVSKPCRATLAADTALRKTAEGSGLTDARLALGSGELPTLCVVHVLSAHLTGDIECP